MLIRVDNRLIHGQIIEGWLPFLNSSRIIVVNDEAATDLFRKMVIEMAVPYDIEVLVLTIDEFSQTSIHDGDDWKNTIVLFGNIIDALKAYELNFRFDKLNIGNVHSEEGKICFTPSIFLNERDVNNLMHLIDRGVEVEVRSVPRDRPIDFRDVAKEMKM